MRLPRTEIYYILSLFVILSACTGSDFPGYRKTASGLHYKIHHRGEGKNKAGQGDIMQLAITYRTSEDSVFFDSRSSEKPFVVPFRKPRYEGDIYEGLAMLSEGDSATFITNMDSFLQHTAVIPYIPDYLDVASSIFLDVKVLKIMTRQEFKYENARRIQEKNNAILESRKRNEVDKKTDNK